MTDKVLIDVNDIDNEVQVLHLMAQLAELVDGNKKTYELCPGYTLFFHHDRVSVTRTPEDWTSMLFTCISAKVDRNRIYDNSDSEPYMQPGNIYLYNENALTTFLEFKSVQFDNQITTHEVLLEDFRDPSSESTLFQLSTVLEPEVLLGVVLNSQMYNFLIPDMVHYRRTGLRIHKLPYDEFIPALVKVIEEHHGR